MQILNIFHVLVAIALVGFVLIQKGQGATAGASFGAGASATVFGSRGAGNFLTRATWILAALFCAISLTMAVVVSRTVGEVDTDLGVIANAPVQQDAASQDAGDSPEVPVTISVESQDADDLPVVDSMAEDAADDVPPFEAPDGAGAIEGSEVTDTVPGEAAGEPGEDG